MDHIPTDIFEDLLNDVVGSKYSGPPLAAADLAVLSVPQPQIDMAKVADKERFTRPPIFGHHQKHDRVLSGPQPQIDIGQVADNQRFIHGPVLGHHQLDRGRLLEASGKFWEFLGLKETTESPRVGLPKSGSQQLCLEFSRIPGYEPATVPCTEPSTFPEAEPTAAHIAKSAAVNKVVSVAAHTGDTAPVPHAEQAMEYRNEPAADNRNVEDMELSDDEESPEIIVLAGPQPYIDKAKVADNQRFTQGPIFGHHQQYVRVPLGPNPPIDRANVADNQRFIHGSTFGHHQQHDRDISRTQIFNYGGPNKPGSQLEFLRKDVTMSHSPSICQTFSIPHDYRDQNHGNSQSVDSSRPSFGSMIKFVKAVDAENKDSISTTKILHTSDADANAGSSKAKYGRDMVIPGIDARLADPECLLMIKNLLQYSYNKWRVNNYDVEKPKFWFLFENTSEEYKYYRLKLAQLLQLKNNTMERECQVNGHERTTGDVGTQTDLTSQHPATSTLANNPEPSQGVERDMNPKRFTAGLSLLPRTISTPGQNLSHQSIKSQKTVPRSTATTPNAGLASQNQKHMEAIKSVTTKPFVDSKSLINVQFPEIDEITKQALHNLAHVHVISQEQNKGFEMLKGPAYWFLTEKLSPVYKYYRMKLTELRQARGLSDDSLECGNHSDASSTKDHGPKTLDNESTEPQVSEDDHPESQGSEAEHPEALSHEQKQPGFKGSAQQRSKTVGPECRESKPECSRPLESKPDKFELLVTCSDDEDSDVGDSSPLIIKPLQPQAHVSQSHQPDQKLSFQELEHHSSVLQDDLVHVTEEESSEPLEEIDLTSKESLFFSKAKQSICPKPLQDNWELNLQDLKPQQQLHQTSLDQVSSQPPQDTKSNLTDNTSDEAMQTTTVKKLPISRKRGRLSKGVTVPPKRMHPAGESTVSIKPLSKEPEESEDLIEQNNSKEGTSSINDKGSPEGGGKEVLDPGPEKILASKPVNVTTSSTNVALSTSKKRVTRLKK